jgi:site-specific DNA recombinase
LTRPRILHSHDPVFEDARLQPFPDQTDDALVADPMLQEADKPFLTDRPEKVLDIGVQDPVHFPMVDRDA